MQKKVLPLLPDIQSYDIIYLIKNMLSTKSHTEAYGKAKSSLICCIYQVFTPPPPLTLIYTSEATTYTAGSTRRAAFGVSSAVWGGQV